MTRRTRAYVKLPIGAAIVAAAFLLDRPMDVIQAACGGFYLGVQFVILLSGD